VYRASSRIGCSLDTESRAEAMMETDPKLRSLGPYRLIRRLGSGGMGEVWEAYREDRPEQRVALKSITVQDAPGRREARKLIDEAAIGAALRHPNIVLSHGHCTAGENVVLVMELLQGMNLSVLCPIPGEPLPIGFVAGIAVQALAGLDYAQSCLGPDKKPLAVVHRDIKRSNLLLTDDGVLKIIDFGIALARNIEVTQTSDHLRGSLPYLSPEQIRHEPLDGRSDLFSLSLVLHELLTGRRVFTQPDAASLLSAVLFQPIPTVCALRADVPVELGNALGWALNKERDRRPESAAALSRAIIEALPRGSIWGPRELAAFLRARKSQAPAGGAEAPQTQTNHPRLTPPALDPSRALTHTPKRRVWIWATAGAAAFTALGAFGAVAVISLLSADRTEARLEPAVSDRVVDRRPAEPHEVPTTTRSAASPKPVGMAQPEQGPKRAAPRKHDAPPARADGWITIDSSPRWARIKLDGREIGPTPVFRVPVSPGSHVVEAVDADGSVQRQLIRVGSGAGQKLLIHW
jgi:serine/threonine-protein kinase